ncbi:MAG TPA: T6SS immunity protein Tdi1 domain-containing protein [Caulobacteraceae bacterium]|nr:T6SS immunity protein Tdi1 domain-containing protein [Caulobacteraceae bacterium]
MSVTWRDIAFQMGPDLAREVAKAWSWLLPGPWEPIVCSMVAGVFLETSTGEVFWLDTGTGLVEQVASNRAQFEDKVRSSPDLVDEWFLPPVVDRLHGAGKIPEADQCFGFAILPVFAEGKYDTENMFVVPVREQFVGMADVHRQLADLPDGNSVQLKVID